MKVKIAYTVAIILVLASWAGNYAYNRQQQLPEGGFLRHYIEVRDIPSVAFDLLYVANRDDDIKPVSATIEALPKLRFYPLAVHTEMRHQTIYKLMGYFEDFSQISRPASDPLTIRTATVRYSDGTLKEENIGEIVLYREALPLSADSAPYQMVSSSGSSDHSGTVTFRMERPATLIGTNSNWLDKLGSYFQFDESITGSGRGSAEGANQQALKVGTYPLELEKDQTVSLSYKFLIPNNSAQSMEVYNLLLGQRLRGEDGREWTYYTFANYVPYPSESEMQAYVREKRREAR